MDTLTVRRDPGAASAAPVARNGAPPGGRGMFTAPELAFMIGVPAA